MIDLELAIDTHQECGHLLGALEVAHELGGLLLGGGIARRAF